MKGIDIFSSINNLINFVIWPAVVLIIAYILKNNIKSMLTIIEKKLDAAKQIGISKDGLTIITEVSENKQQIDIMTSQFQLLNDRFLRLENLASAATAGGTAPVLPPESESTPEKIRENKESLKTMASEYDTIKNSDEAVREDRMRELGRKMGKFVIQNKVSKEWIVTDATEGLLLALAFSIMIKPEDNDQNFLFETYKKVTDIFLKFSFLGAIEVIWDNLPEGKSFTKPDLTKIYKMAQDFEKNADMVLQGKIIKVNKRYAETLTI